MQKHAWYASRNSLLTSIEMSYIGIHIYVSIGTEHFSPANTYDLIVKIKTFH